MQIEEREHVLIVGAGLAGALLACFMAQRGYRVTVCERRPDPRAHGFVGGRSINLALSTRGITALRQVGLEEEVLRDAIPMPGRMIHDPHGNLTFQPYSKNPDDAINSVSRGGLNITLVNAASSFDNVSLVFNQRCVDIDFEAPAVVFHSEETEEESRIDADFIVGADGAFSAVRDAMLRKVQNVNYRQEFLEHGYKELSIPATGKTGRDSEGRAAFAMEPHALHIWPRGGSMMIALPNRDGSFTCTLFWPYEGEHSFASIRCADDVVPFFQKHYPDAVSLMPTLVEDYMNNPVGSLVTVRCGPWHDGGRVMLIGDAAHAIVPFFGQGMNAAFEDCRLLDESLARHSNDRAAAFQHFFRMRRNDADAIADMALGNFIEMRDKTAKSSFRLKKKLEHTLHRLFPRWFVPLYNMVSFSNIPYATARRRAARQWRVVIAVTAAAIILLLAVMIVFLL